ncbi:DUF5320 domain-containing protein [Desulfoplanes formicivorans]|uniref:Cytoplasmic protein n=1 Tax=Desulfoplanes formicivorans TaxID=1592317 RepID=A0A194AK14_9BACT|nr:DUF5320 domain-containing protein [Desulfoplanes formicivorans]GAU09653.1 hypothetical protein DPF_2384 [Desulfoplanes formicivorans]
MPGFDGTGPRGQGPMTGGGFGRCSGTGYGMRPGFGRGGNRARAWSRLTPAGRRVDAPMQPMDETLDAATLDNRIATLTRELEQLRKQRQNLD